jgi:hypothetical protein
MVFGAKGSLYNDLALARPAQALGHDEGVKSLFYFFQHSSNMPRSSRRGKERRRI